MNSMGDIDTSFLSGGRTRSISRRIASIVHVGVKGNGVDVPLGRWSVMKVFDWLPIHIQNEEASSQEIMEKKTKDVRMVQGGLIKLL